MGDLTISCLEFLNAQDLTSRVNGPGAVCKAWATAALHAQARVYSDFEVKVEEGEGGEGGG